MRIKCTISLILAFLLLTCAFPSLGWEEESEAPAEISIEGESPANDMLTPDNVTANTAENDNTEPYQHGDSAEPQIEPEETPSPTEELEETGEPDPEFGTETVWQESMETPDELTDEAGDVPTDEPPTSIESEGTDDTLYAWENLSDDAFFAWIIDASHTDYIIALYIARSQEYLLFNERIDYVRDNSVREQINAYIDALLSKEVEADTEEESVDIGYMEEPEEVGADSVDGAENSPADTESEVESPFSGPPDGFVLSKKQIKTKASLYEAGVPKHIATLKEGRDYVAGTLIFRCNDREYALQVANIYGAVLTDCSFGIATIVLQKGTVAEAVALAADPNNSYPPVEPDYIIPFIEEPGSFNLSTGTIPSGSVPVSESWDSWIHADDANPDTYLLNPSSTQYQWQHDMVNTYEAWGVTMGSGSVIVAVVDSGVNTSHPDLHDITPIDVGCGTEPYGDHGTHVAGIIAATFNNGKGGAGIAPGVSILSIRVIEGSGRISNASLIRGINAAVSNGADIINISIGGADHSIALEETLIDAYNAGVTVIASAGNNGDNMEMYPAAYSTVIAVGSVDRTGHRSDSSSYGSWVNISAPGEDIWSTGQTGYKSMSGTSMACPMVSGVAALYMSRMGHVSPKKMRSVLLSSVNKCYSSGMGAGIIDASKLFAGDKTPPGFELDGITVAGAVKAKVTSELCFTGFNSDSAIVYTINGTTPTVANGSVKNGFLCEEGYISIGDLGPVGTTWTVKAVLVNGLGVRSNVATINVTIVGSDEVYALHIAAPAEFHAGKSVSLSVNAEPKYSSAEVVWSIVDRDGAPNVTISTNGLLRASSTDYGSVTIRATSKVNTNVYDETTVVIKRTDLAIAISLPKTATLIYSNGTRTSKQITAKFKTKSGAIFEQAPTGSFNGIQAVWTSSNKKVATVDAYGLITATGTGTCKITCRAIDGSGVSKTCTVTVKRGADSITVTGQSAIAAGTYAVYKAVFTPSNTANRTVAWSLENAPDGVYITSKGKLVIPVGTPEASFTVCATAKDGTEVTGKTVVCVVPRVSSLSLQLPVAYQGVRYTTYRGTLKTLTLYTVDIPDSEATDNSVDLAYLCEGPDYSLYWTSSNPNVASVDQNGKVTAHKSGTTTVTIRANDGSGKKASVTVYVKVPASSLTIVPARKTASGDCFIGVGCSVSNKAIPGTGYGTPNSCKVSWSIDLIAIGDEDVTDIWKAKKWATVNSSGTIKISKYASSAIGSAGYGFLVLKAYRAEEGLEAEFIYIITPKITSINVYPKTMYLTAQKGDGVCDTDAAVIYSNSITDGCFSVSSSDPDIAGASLKWDKDSSRYYILVVANKKPGTAYITVKAQDGSGKTAKIKVIISR